MLGSKRTDFSVALFPHGWIQNSVIGTIRGVSAPDEIVVIGAHLDSINQQNRENAPGADDDASGVAVVTETLRVLTEIGFKPRRTIQFIAYAAEEVGLRGSGEIADKYKSEGRNVIAALQMDMTGFKGSERDVYLINDFVSPELNSFLLHCYKNTTVQVLTKSRTLKRHAATRALIITHGRGTACTPPFRSRQRSQTITVQSTLHRTPSPHWTRRAPIKRASQSSGSSS